MNIFTKTMKNFSPAGITLALLVFSGASHATQIKANYHVSLNDTDPGLILHNADVASNPLTLNLTAGEATTFDLFQIWTDEGSINHDDQGGKSISANFDFSLPESFSGSVTGTTLGGNVFFFEGGLVNWDGPADLYFGPKHDGHLRISLSDEIFNAGLFGLNPGRCRGATVKATMKLLQNATAVPEPGTLGIFGFGLLGLCGVLRRKRSRL